MVAVRKDRGLPAPRGAAPRAASRQGEISPPTSLAPNRAPTSPCPLPPTPAPPRARAPRRASLLAVQQADDDIFVQPQLLHAHAALLLERMHRGAEHLVAGVFEYYSWMPQVAASHA